MSVFQAVQKQNKVSSAMECTVCHTKPKILQRFMNQTEPSTVSPTVNHTLTPKGQSPDASIHASIKPHFGHDFSQMRIHNDAQDKSVLPMSERTGRMIPLIMLKEHKIRFPMNLLSMSLLNHLFLDRSEEKLMDTKTKVMMSNIFARNFDNVRVHSDVYAKNALHVLETDAFTYGAHVYINPDKYPPYTSRGFGLLKHELTHVIQQGNPAADRNPPAGISHDMSLEREARRNEDSVNGESELINHGSPVGVIQRDSLSEIYERKILENIKEGNYAEGYLWTFLLTSHDALTFGFLSTHDPAYEAWERGDITDDEYLANTVRAVGRSAAVGTAVVVTGGVAGAAGEGLAVGLSETAGLSVGATSAVSTVAGGVVGGAAAGGAGQLTADVYDIATTEQGTISDFETYAKAIGVGAASGLVVGGVAAGGAKVAPSSAAKTAEIYAARYPLATKTLGGIRESAAKLTAPAPTGVWEMGPAPRGLAIEDILSADIYSAPDVTRLPPNFKTIDWVKGGTVRTVVDGGKTITIIENGVGVSGKSIDLAGSSVRTAEGMQAAIGKHIDSLVEFDTYTLSGVRISNLNGRALDVRIGNGIPTDVQIAGIRMAGDYAEASGVTLVVRFQP